MSCNWWLSLVVWCSIAVGVTVWGATTEEELDKRLSIIQGGTTIFVKAGEKRAFFCKGTEPNKRWLNVRGEVVRERSPTARAHVELAFRSSQLVLFVNYATVADTGTWTCRARSLNRTIDIYVLEVLKFEEKNKVMTAVEDDPSVTLSCSAHGTPQPELFWYKDHQAIQVTNNSNKFRKHKSSAAGWSTLNLEILNVAARDAGEYACKGLQQVGTEYFNTIDMKKILIVHHKPTTESDSIQNAYGFLNSTKMLVCSSHVSPKPSYKWLKQARHSWETDLYDNVTSAADGSHSVLKLELKNETDLGTYVCQISNRYGRWRNTYYLSLGNQPNPLQKVVFKSAHKDSLEFSVTCGDCPTADEELDPSQLHVIKYRIEAINYSSPKDWDKHGSEAITEDFDHVQNQTVVATLGGLAPATLYQVRAAAVNLAGLSEYTSLGPRYTASATAATSVAILVATLALVLLSRPSLPCH